MAVLGVVRLAAGLEGRSSGRVPGPRACSSSRWRRSSCSAPSRGDTEHGDQVLAELRSRQHDLDPANKPNWTVYGPAAAALGVGLFGVERALGLGSGDGRRAGGAPGRRSGGAGGTHPALTEAVATQAVVAAAAAAVVEGLRRMTPQPADHRRCRPGSGSAGGPRSPAGCRPVPGSPFCELIAGTLAPAGPPRGVAELRERGYRWCPHGVGLSPGRRRAGRRRPGDTPRRPAPTRWLRRWSVSTSAFVRAGGREAGHLLPVPRTREALDVLTANIRRTQAELGRAAGPGTDRGAVRLAGRTSSPKPDFLTELLVPHRHAAAAGRGQPVRQRAQPRAGSARPARPASRWTAVAYLHVAGRLRARRALPRHAHRPGAGRGARDAAASWSTRLPAPHR